MSLVLFDNIHRKRLYPFTETRSVSAIRIGLFTMSERWERLTGIPSFTHTENYLQNLYGYVDDGDHYWIDASVIPTPDLLQQLPALKKGEALADETGLIIGRTDIHLKDVDPVQALSFFEKVTGYSLVERIQYPWQLVQWNDRLLRMDFNMVTQERTSQPLSDTNQCIQPESIFIEPGARVEYAILNASTGPIYIGKNAAVMEGTSIRGPFALGENAVLKMNSRIYGASSLGPYCIGGGEIKNSIMMGYSNKAHDGYMGDAVIGEWCNWGAGTSNSNVKNTAGIVKVWSEADREYLEAGYKCGVMMGDFSRTAINTAINTGTVVGVSANLFGEGLLPNIITDFSWGCKGVKYRLDKLFEDIHQWKKMKNAELSDMEKSILLYLYKK